MKLGMSQPSISAWALRLRFDSACPAGQTHHGHRKGEPVDLFHRLPPR